MLASASWTAKKKMRCRDCDEIVCKKRHRLFSESLNSAFDARFPEIFLRILTDVGHQMVKRIILRVDRPDHFVQGLKHLAGIVGYGTHLLLVFNRDHLATPGVLA